MSGLIFVTHIKLCKKQPSRASEFGQSMDLPLMQRKMTRNMKYTTKKTEILSEIKRLSPWSQLFSQNLKNLVRYSVLVLIFPKLYYYYFFKILDTPTENILV